jgi:hypothetical protein
MRGINPLLLGRLFLLLVFPVPLAMLGCGQEVPPSAKKPGPSAAAPRDPNRVFAYDEEPRVQLTITPQGPQRRDAIRIKAEVINRSDTPVTWDSEWSFPLYWKFLPDEEMFALAQRTVRKVKQTQQSLSKGRFVSIPPGQRLS